MCLKYLLIYYESFSYNVIDIFKINNFYYNTIF